MTEQQDSRPFAPGKDAHRYLLEVLLLTGLATTGLAILVSGWDKRHYGIVHGAPNRRAWRRLGIAFLAALAFIVVVVMVGALVTA